MVGLPLICLLFFASLCIAAPQSSTITYQVHSYNDLREWPQILRKGTVYFKYPTGLYRRRGERMEQLEIEGGNYGRYDKRCFDKSTEWTHTTCTAHFALHSPKQHRAIQDPQYAVYYKNPARKIYIAFCFKLDNANPCDGSVIAQNWTATTDQLFEAANAIVANKGLNVEFILDGSSTPTDSNLCLINKWRPWIATWIPGDSEAAPYSNNVTLGLDRFQVFNPPAVLGVPAYYIDLWQLQDYGKFSQSNYSYLIWEPSDQQPILDISDSYLRGPLHALGLRFAINIDPVQLQVFAGTASGTAWNNEIASNSGSSFVSPALAVIASADSGSFFIISTFIDSTTFGTYYTVSTAASWNNDQLGPVASTATKQLPSDLPVNSLSVLSSNAVFASKPNGTYEVFSFNESVQELSSGVVGQLLPCSDCKSVAVIVNDGVYAIQLINGNTNCSLLLQVWELQNATKPNQVGSVNCIQNNIRINNYDIAFSGVQQGESFCSAGELPGILTFSDPYNSIYTSVLCLNTSTGAVEVNGGSGEGPPGGVAVDVGSDTAVSLYTFDGQLLVLEVHDDGFCWNSEPNNKQPMPATCSNTPKSIQYMLNYNFGSFDDWATHVMNVINNKNTSYDLDSIFSSCHPTILHGAYDSGSSPRVALFSASSSSQEVLLHAEVHIGLPKKFSNTSQCGFAVPREGAVMLDSWSLATWTAL